MKNQVIQMHFIEKLLNKSERFLQSLLTVLRSSGTPIFRSQMRPIKYQEFDKVGLKDVDSKCSHTLIYRDISKI